MIEGQKQVIEYAKTLGNLLGEVEKSADKDAAEKLGQQAAEQELFCPVIGEFSAGKTSMINTLLGHAALPVEITPETALATELRYSADERLEAVREDGGVDKYATGEAAKMTANSERYTRAAAYFNCGKLQEIEPITLVDMPGFNSPKDNHNKAITAFLGKGAHYIALSSAETGTITASMLRQLNEISNMGRTFSFFISKANLRSGAELAKVKSYFEDQLAAEFAEPPAVQMLDNTNSDAVFNAVKGLDANALFKRLYRDGIGTLANELINACNIKAKSAKAGIEDLNKATEEIKKSIAKLQSKMQSDISAMQRKYSAGMVDEIVRGVGDALNRSVDEIAAAAAGGSEAAGQVINEIVRSNLTALVNDKLGEISRDVCTDFNASIGDLNYAMKDAGLSDNYLADMNRRVTDAMTLMQTMDEMFNSTVATEVAAGMAKTATTLSRGVGSAAMVGSIVATGTLNWVLPIVSIVLAFLPEIISLFDGIGKEERQKEALRQKIVGQAIPSVKRQLRSKLPEQLAGPVQSLIESVKAQYNEKLQQDQAVLEAQEAEHAKNKEEIDKQIARYEEIRGKAQAIMSDAAGW